MKDKLGAVGVSGRDPADDDDDYTLRIVQNRSLEKNKKDLSPPQRETCPCRPWAGRQAPVARWGGDRAFFFQGPHCEFEEKKLHLRLVALWGGDRGVFLKYFKTDIYF